MLKTYIILILLTLTSYVRSEDKTMCVIVYETNKITAFDIEKKPQISFVNNTIHLQCAGVTCIYPLDNYLKVTIDEAVPSMGIKDISNSPVPYYMFKFSDDVITSTGYGSLSVYDIGGKCLKYAEPDSNGIVLLSVSNLPAGIYVVVSSIRSFKIQKL